MSHPFAIGDRPVGPGCPPLVIAEIGINHNGCPEQAGRLTNAAIIAGAGAVKFQTHVIADELVDRQIVPENADEPLYQMMERCALTEEQERALKRQVESRSQIWLSTPFSRAAVDRLERLGVPAYKIGSGEVSNPALVEYIASQGKPVIMSTGMHGIKAIDAAVQILRRAGVPFSLLHCVSRYPAPDGETRLGAITQIQQLWPDAVVGYSCHARTIWPAIAAVALGADIIEKHFCLSRTDPGVDIDCSMTVDECWDLCEAVATVSRARRGGIEPDAHERETARFALCSVTTTQAIAAGEVLSVQNVFPRRPQGGIPGDRLEQVYGRRAARDLPANSLIQWTDLA